MVAKLRIRRRRREKSREKSREQSKNDLGLLRGETGVGASVVGGAMKEGAYPRGSL